MRECGVTISDIIAMPQKDRDLTYDCILRVSNIEYGMMLHSRLKSGDNLTPEEKMDYEIYYNEENDRNRTYNEVARMYRQRVKE